MCHGGGRPYLVTSPPFRKNKRHTLFIPVATAVASGSVQASGHDSCHSGSPLPPGHPPAALGLQGIKNQSHEIFHPISQDGRVVVLQAQCLDPQHPHPGRCWCKLQVCRRRPRPPGGGGPRAKNTCQVNLCPRQTFQKVQPISSTLSFWPELCRMNISHCKGDGKCFWLGPLHWDTHTMSSVNEGSVGVEEGKEGC